MSEEPQEVIVEEVAVVDLDSNPPDSTLSNTSEGFIAPADEEAPVEEAPVEEPAPEPEAEVPAEEPAEPTTRDVSGWGETGNEVGDSVLGMLEDSGMTPQEAQDLMLEGVESGDISKIDKDALIAKVGKHAANIILQGTETFIAQNAVKVAGIVAEMHATAGSKENWDAVATWANANISDADMNEYRPMIDKGGASARFAVNELMSAYNKDGSNSTLATSTPRAEATSVSPPASQATTKAEYVAALEKAHRQGASPREIATIQANRNSGRKRGI